MMSLFLNSNLFILKSQERRKSCLLLLMQKHIQIRKIGLIWGLNHFHWRIVSSSIISSFIYFIKVMLKGFFTFNSNCFNSKSFSSATYTRTPIIAATFFFKFSMLRYVVVLYILCNYVMLNFPKICLTSSEIQSSAFELLILVGG